MATLARPGAGPPSERMQALEAVRGLAALAVVFSHIIGAFWPVMIHVHGSHPPARALVLRSPLRAVYDGNFAVHIFFVLSGVVLSMAFFRRPSHDALAAAAVRRYFRLTPPIFASVALTYLAMVCGACHNLHAADLMRYGPTEWLRSMYYFPPKFADMLREGTYRVYFGYLEKPTFNGGLWTMSIELYGSFLVFATLALAGTLRRRWVIYLALGTVLYAYGPPMFIDFLLGLALCDFTVARQQAGRPVRLGLAAGVLLVLLGLTVGSAHSGWLTPRVPAAYFKWTTKPAGAVLVIAAALLCPPVQRALERPAFAWLGRVSFALYLLNLPVICTLGCWVFVRLYAGAHWPFGPASAVAGLASLAGCLLGAWGLYHLADRPAIRLSRGVYGLFRPAAPATERPPLAKAA